MGQVTTLIDVVRNLESLDGDATIYVAEPWTAQSSSIVETEPTTGGLPIEASNHGLQYFLEVFIARDFLDDWASGLEQTPSDLQRCERLIRYAKDDA